MTDDPKRPYARFQFLSRMTSAVRLDVRIYEEVRTDHTATLQAVAVVLLAALATGTGLQAGLGFLPQYAISWIINWLAWVLVIYLLGTTLFATPETDADWGQLVRTAGFAQAPAVFNVFGIIPIIGPTGHFGLVVVVTTWLFVAMALAVRRTFNYKSWWRAAAVVGTGFLPRVLIELLLLQP